MLDRLLPARLEPVYRAIDAQAGIPSLLNWLFTDRNYHTNLDTPDKVSAAEMKNVGVSVASSAWLLASATTEDARAIARLIEHAALARLALENAQHPTPKRLRSLVVILMTALDAPDVTCHGHAETLRAEALLLPFARHAGRNERGTVQKRALRVSAPPRDRGGSVTRGQRVMRIVMRTCSLESRAQSRESQATSVVALGVGSWRLGVGELGVQVRMIPTGAFVE